MTLFDLIIKIYFNKKLFLKNFLILVAFNIFGLIFIYTSHESDNAKTLIFKDVPINAKELIYQNYEIRKLVKDGFIISIDIDEFGFTFWDYRFKSKKGLSRDTIEDISNVLFRSIIEYKFHLEQSSSQDPVNINKLKNIKLYIQSQNIDKYEVIDDVNKKLSIQRIISILIQTNILALIIIFIFRIRLML